MGTNNENFESNKHSTYRNLVQGADAITVRDRFDNIYNRLNEFIVSENLTKKVKISITNLEQVLVAYFDDINRIKSFHNINRVNDIKIHAYEAFWLLRKKPLQVLEDFDYCEAINEKFVSFFIVDYILQKKTDVVLSGLKKEHFEEFIKTLYYWFKFRKFDAQSIEIILLSFLAGVAVGSNQSNDDAI